jgi:Mor family transcriptional regulator
MSTGYTGSKRKPGDFAMRLLEITAEVMAESGIDEEQAKTIAREAASRVCWEWGGNRVNVQRDPAFGGLTKRDREMWDAFDGTNYEELANRFGLGWRMVRYIIKHCRRWHKANTQVELPGMDVEQPQEQPREAA